jgi:hypothetical protein
LGRRLALERVRGEPRECSRAFIDARLNDPLQFPVAARAGFGNVRNTPDLITSKLPALQ